MKNLFNIVKKKRKAVIIVCGLLMLAVVILLLLPTLFITSERMGFEETAAVPATGQLNAEDGKKLVGESDTKKLSIDTRNLNLIVEDKKSGRVWNSIYEKSKKGSDLSILNVVYLGEDNSIKEWDSYDYSVKQNTYQIYTIENGVQIHMNFNAGESSSFYEYMPMRMSTERYTEFFLGGLDKAKDEGKVTGDQVAKYKNTLGLIYAKSKTEDLYIINYVGNPPTSAVKQLIEVAKLVGYTTDHLLEDANEHGFSVSFAKPAVFDIVLEAVLEGDELVVRVPSSMIQSQNDFYAIQNIKVLPNFGATEVSEVEEGYLFVPDGAGALLKMNDYNPKIPDYTRDLYDNNYFKNYYYMPEHGEDLMMPVFGMLYHKGSKPSSGFLGIIEEGADSGYIDVKLASADSNSASGGSLNKVSASFDRMQYKAVKVSGEYNTGGPTYLVTTDSFPVDITLRYLLYPEKVSYFTMAQSYKEYLLRRTGKEERYPTDAKMYLEVLGTLSLQERFLGIPYEAGYSMTTYKELSAIISDLGERNLILSYLGAFDGGMNNKLMKKGSLVKENGSKKELLTLMEEIKNSGNELFLEADFLKIYNKGNGFNSKLHGLHDFSSSTANIWSYNLAMGTFTSFGNKYYILNPKYLTHVVSSFIKNEDITANLYLEDMAHSFYANYSKNDEVSSYEAQSIIDKNIEILREDRELALHNPRIDKLHMGKYAVDISRKSSEYGTFYSTIPFRQLVMNGIIEFTTKSVNNNSLDERYYLLQSLELGAYPKFTISAKSVDVFKDSNYGAYYSIQYSKLETMIKSIYDQYKEAMDVIGVAKIVDHQTLAENVFLTEYENGTKIITNYNGKAVSVSGYELEPYGYYID